MKEIKISGDLNSLKKDLIIGIGGLIFALLVPLILSEGPIRILTFTFGLFFIGFYGGRKVLLLASKLNFNKSLITMNGDGIYDRTYGLGFIPWSNIKSAKIYDHNRTILGINQSFEMIELELLDEELYLNSDSNFTKKLLKFGRDNSHAGYWINTTHLNIPRHKLLSEIQSFL